MDIGFEMKALYVYGLLIIGAPSAIWSLLLRDDHLSSPGFMNWLLFPCRAWQMYRHGTAVSVSFVLMDELPKAYFTFMALIWPLRVAFNVVCWTVIGVVLVKDHALGTGLSSGRSHVAGLAA